MWQPSRKELKERQPFLPTVQKTVCRRGRLGGGDAGRDSKGEERGDGGVRGGGVC